MSGSSPATSAPSSGIEEGRAWQLIILASAAFFSPLMVWAASSERASLLGFVVIGLTVCGVSVGIRLVLTRLGCNPLGSTYAVALFGLCFTNLGLILNEPLNRLALFAVALSVGAIGYRLRRMKILRLSIAWGAAALLAYPILLGIGRIGDDSAVSLLEPAPIQAEFVREKRDIVLVVLDGYANAAVLSSLYGYDNRSFEEKLATSGFITSRGLVANYGRTRFSVSSVVQLDYPAGEGGLTAADLDLLLEYVGGQNVLAEWLGSEGYNEVYVESGWFGTRCGETVDVCVEGPIPDESFYDVAYRSLLQGLPGFETGRSFSRGAQRVIEWLEDDLEPLLINDRPDYIYAHALLPHPPLFLDSDCVMKAQQGFSGFTIAQPGMSNADLNRARQWYTGQVECTNSVLLRVAEMVNREDAIALFLGDHGPDSLGQLYTAGAEWSEPQRQERLGALFVARVPGCDMGDIRSLVNSGRRLVSCLSNAEYENLPTHTYDFAFVESRQNLIEIETPVFDS